MVGKQPPPLSRESAAFRCAGFGTHEIVLYYDLVRFLINDCWERVAGRTEPRAQHEREGEVQRLEALRDEWLHTPNMPDLHGRTPASVIERERLRLPEAVTGAEAAVDPDCPVCQMMAEDMGPYFWHLDGCNMDWDFAFSFHATQAEWAEEQREYEEFSKKCDADRARREAEAPPSVWQRSFSAGDLATEAPTAEVLLLGIGRHLSELTEDLKETGADRSRIDAVQRDFGNLREVTRAAALVEPVAQRFGETLHDVAEAHPHVAAKCEDVERQVRAAIQRLAGVPQTDDDLPF
jgi:hypothetical protein